MSRQRKISWSSALQEMRNDRTFIAPPANLAERIARDQAREENTRRYVEAERALRIAAARPLATANAYDRSAILKLANAIVREQIAARPLEALTHRALIGKALKRAWATARDARRAAAH